MRKILCLLLTVALCICITACNKANTNSNTSNTPTVSDTESITENKTPENVITSNSNISYLLVNELHYDDSEKILVNLKSEDTENVYTIFSFASQQPANAKYQLKNLHDETVVEFTSKDSFYHIIALNIPEEDYTLWRDDVQFAFFAGYDTINISVVDELPADSVQESVMIPTEKGEPQMSTSDKPIVNIKVEGTASSLFHITTNHTMFKMIAEYQGDNK